MPDRAAPVVLLATSAAHPDLTPDDRLFAAVLARRGVAARGAVWDDPGIDWSVESVVVRSTWDYFLRPNDFLQWAARTADRALLQNVLSVIAWNAHKEYLSVLYDRGVSIIETELIPAGNSVDLVALAKSRGWGELVIKPAVSAAGYETHRFGAEQRTHAQLHLDRLLAAGDAMVQPYLARLAEHGELSAIFIGGQFSHGIRRRSAFAPDKRMPGAARETPPAEAIRFAERVLADALTEIGEQVPNAPLLYARVDLAERGPGEWLLLELELIEPSLFFTHAPEAAERMADVLLQRL